MKRILFFAAVLFPLMSFAQHIDFRTDWEKDELKGKVKKVSTNTGNGVRVKTYNPLGFITEIENDYFAARVKNTYDSNKILLSEEFDEAGSRKSFTKFEYDNQGLLISYTEQSNYGPTVGRYEYNSDKTLKSFMRFEGDTDQYDYLVEFVYDKGVLVETNEFGPDRSPYIWAIYNEKEQVVEYKKWRSDGTLRIHGRYLYDDNGFMVEWDEEIDGMWQVYQKYENDKHGNVVKEISYSGNEIDIDTFTYEYDKQGNWTKKDERYDEEYDLHHIETRVIEYY